LAFDVGLTICLLQRLIGDLYSLARTTLLFVGEAAHLQLPINRCPTPAPTPYSPRKPRGGGGGGGGGGGKAKAGVRRPPPQLAGMGVDRGVRLDHESPAAASLPPLGHRASAYGHHQFFQMAF
jgi:hypothetical protein